MMRRMKIKKWEAKQPGGEMKKESLLDLVTALINSIQPQNLPRSFDKFRIFGRVSRAFEDVTETGDLVLEEEEYGFIHDLVNENIPAIWALNPDYREAIESFMELKEEKANKQVKT